MMMDAMLAFVRTAWLPAVIAFAVCALIGPLFIKWLVKLKYGQEIREEGPKWHKNKSGTPTMGGIMFIIGITAAAVVCIIIAAARRETDLDIFPLLTVLCVSLGYGAIGFADDFIKVVKKRNLGLTAIQKFLLQLILAVIYIVIMAAAGRLDSAIVIPFSRYVLHIPMWLYIIFVLFVVLGTVNAVNLTDGLDGLASSVTLIVALFFAVYAAFRLTAPRNDIIIYGTAVFGGLIAFLIYNHHPAKVFMGDTGSLFLGSSVSLMAVAMNMHIYIIIAGFVFFAETLSVIIQTSYFKYTKKRYGKGRRVFKMTPIHHHFEMCGWKETRIVAVFAAVTLVLCIVAFFA